MQNNNDIYFNELCLQDMLLDYSVITNLRDCFQKLKNEAFSVCRLNYENKVELLNYLKSIPGVSERDLIGFFHSFFRSPFEKSNISTEDEEKFLSSNLYFEDKQTIGLQWAYTYDTLAFSLLTNDKWNRDSITVIDKADENKSILIHHAATVANIDAQKAWIDSLKDIELEKTALMPEQKLFNVSGTHHGNDKRRLFWDKIKNNEYVVSCITSTENHSRDKTLIHKVYSDGKIELVLYWEDSGYSMLIQTTGRNYRETKKIADILTEKYSK